MAIREDFPSVEGQKVLSSGTLSGPGTKDNRAIDDSNQTYENAEFDRKKRKQGAGRQPE